MWLLYAVLSAVFASLTSIFAKIGIRGTDSNLLTALRCCVVVIFSWAMVFLTGAQAGITDITPTALLFLILSGLCTGGSWICYFRALSAGDVNRVVPIDKSSTILTILLCFILFGEPVSPLRLLALAALGAGIFLMIEKKPGESRETGRGWMTWAVLSALLAAMTTVFGKLGVRDVNADLGSAIRTCVALLLAWALVIGTGKVKEIRTIPKKSWGFILLSGMATGASWLCYYRALKDGLTSVVVAIDKLSLLLTIGFAMLFFGERLTRRSGIGLALMTLGTALMLAV